MSPGRRRAAWRGLAAGLAGAVALAASAFPLTTGLDLRLLDLALRWLPLTAPAPPVVLVAIDEPSLEAFGPWPWSRRRLADQLDRLRSVAPAAVAIDLLLAEPAAADPEADAALAASMARLGKVVLAVAGTYHDRNTPALEVLPEPSLADAVAALGHTNAAADPDGHLRRLHRRAGVGTAYWPTLAGAALAVARGEPAPLRRGSEGHRGWVARGEVLLPLAPALSRVQRVSFHALAEAGPRDLPQGAVLVIGVTAAGLGPEFQVPAAGGARTLRGAEVQAAAMMALAAGAAITPLDAVTGALLAALAAGGCLAMAAFSSRRLLLLIPFGVLAPMAISLLLAVHGRLWWAPGPAGLGLVLAAGGLLAHRAIRELLSLRALRQRAELALRSIADAVITTDPKGQVVDLNPAARAMLELGPGNSIGVPLHQLLRLPGDAGLLQPAQPLELSLPQPDGPPLELRAMAAPLAGSLGGGGYVVTLSNVTAERRLMREMARRATHDPLTSLANRSLLDDRIDRSLARARRLGQLVAIAFLDLDRFKPINDDLGHAAGDAVLREVALRLAGAARETDTVGRIGGDEFVLVLDDLRSEADALATLQRLLPTVAAPIEIGRHTVRVTGSVGVSLFPRHGASRAELLRRADTAMYRAKQTGRGRILVYGPEMDEGARDRLWLERALRHIIEQDGISLHYQPRVTLNCGRVERLECLARWTHPERGAIPPSTFIPLAETTGLIVPLGRQIVAQAASALARWRRDRPGLGLSINLSVAQLKEDDRFIDYVRTTLAREGLAPAAIEFEVTESIFLDPALPVVDRRLRELVAMGIGLAIDDFGTGYSSLGYLRRFPFAAIKIDRSFVREIGSDNGRAIMEAIVGLGLSLGKRLVAEGVETSPQLELVRRLGCHEAQGYLLGRPEPADAVPALLAA